MYYCDSCGACFETPKIITERHGLDSPPYEEFPACPNCGDTMFIKMVQCDCCLEYTPFKYVKTADNRIYCEDCFTMEDPAW